MSLTDIKTEVDLQPTTIFPCAVINLIPNFNGSNDVEDFVDRVDLVGKLINLNSNQCKWLSLLKLEGKAKSFVKSHEDLRNNSSWEILKQELVKRFKDHKLPGEAEAEFQNCTQNVGETVIEFAERLRRIGKLTVSFKDNELENKFLRQHLENNMLRIFVLGLSKDIKQRVLSKGPKSFKEALQVAEHEELVEKVITGNKFKSERELKMIEKNRCSVNTNAYESEVHRPPMRQRRSSAFEPRDRYATKQINTFRSDDFNTHRNYNTYNRTAFRPHLKNEREICYVNTYQPYGNNRNAFNSNFSHGNRFQSRFRNNEDTKTCYNRRNFIRCFHCNRVGHIRRYCPELYQNQNFIRDNKRNFNSEDSQPVAENNHVKNKNSLNCQTGAFAIRNAPMRIK